MVNLIKNMVCICKHNIIFNQNLLLCLIFTYTNHLFIIESIKEDLRMMQNELNIKSNELQELK